MSAAAESYTSVLAQERLILDVTEQIVSNMQECGVTRSELARRLGVTKPYITNILNGNRNMTLRTLVRFADALDLSVKVVLS